jgi:hypothetical protein
MIFYPMPSKNKTGAKSSIRTGLGSAVVLLAAGILFMMLFLCSSAAGQTNPSPGAAFDAPYNQLFSDGVTLDSWQYVRMKMQLPVEGNAATQRFKTTREEADARAREAEPGLATMAEPAFDPDGILYYSGPYQNYASGSTPRGAITRITVTSGGSGYSANPLVAIVDLYGTGKGATATATVVRGVVTAISINPGGSGSGYTAPIVAIIDATGRGATATAEMDGIPAGGASWFVDSQTAPGAANPSSLPQYNPAVFPDTMAYPPGGKGYTSAPAIYITDITGRGANAAAGVSGGSVTRVTMINGGSGYSQNPVVTFLGGGATMQAVGKATVVGGVITEIKLLGCDYYEIELGAYGGRLIDPAMQGYGWDYVYYCHLFSNEELEMMYGISFVTPPRAPSNLRATVGPYVILSWTDNSASESGFLLQRATNPAFTAGLVNIAVGPNVVSYIDTSSVMGRTYYYRVQAFNVVGDRFYPAPAVGYPGEYVSSAFSNTVTAAKWGSGQTVPGATNWQAFDNNIIYVDVDTTAAGFAATPRYFTSLGGTGNQRNAQGISAVYSATPTGFRLYLMGANGVVVTPAYANNNGWYVQWLGVPISAINAGATPIGATNWQVFSSNLIYVDVDTSAAGFTATPRYFTSLGGTGDQRNAQGISAIYSATPTGFRVYLQGTNGVVATPAYANSNGWHVQWLGMPTYTANAGATPIGATNWQVFSSNLIYVDVDTSAAGFTATPRYITSLDGTGNQRNAQGISAIYSATPTGFRLYLQGMNGVVVTPAYANSNGWHVLWLGVMQSPLQ